MKRVLIITPHFPPVNAPDMQRVRMSLGYFRENGWEPTVMMVDERLVSGFKDELLTETLPSDVEIIKVGAYPENITRKIGLGSISLRSLRHFKNAGNKLLRSNKFDLVFFSTSNHHVCVLGRCWKKKFGVPFVVDMQDPWRNDIHLTTERYKQSAKYRMAYAINKHTEAYAMPYADGIISVSQAYIDTLKERYPSIKDIPAKVITFGSYRKDFELVKEKNLQPASFNKVDGKINVLYMGAVTPFFIPVIRIFFEALIHAKEDLNKYHFYFIGTSYAKSSGITMVADLARELDISEHVTEIPDRVPYFSSLATLSAADVLFIPGSTDKDYNASKVYNNILSGTPIFSIFHQQSSVIHAIKDSSAGVVYAFNEIKNDEDTLNEIATLWNSFIANRAGYVFKGNDAVDFTADKKTKEICAFFNTVIQH